MVRTLLLAATLLGLASCRPARPTDLLGRSASTATAPARAPAPARPAAGELLAAAHQVPITIEKSAEISGGAVVVYTYLADDPLAPECRALAVAYFDARGELLDRLQPSSACLLGIRSLEAYDLTPRSEDELMLIATFAGSSPDTDANANAHSTQIHILAIEPNDAAEDPRTYLLQQLVVELATEHDDGRCKGGIQRSFRVASLGTIEVFSQAWSACTQADCIEPDDEDVRNVDPGMICQGESVTAERSVWQAELGEWGALEPRGFEGTELPDGIMQ